ncbi:hypothetical protein HMPREF0322_03303 [Desulfitobacterium hafniense DP7]|uniref:Uncharacterized protein n=1 Tax=Desulfitobacterium hafniense DP7 TaxID=537010 RepID=G9XQQ5_DESHA|nr:hypothetical protein HMPREF0322_03303 [Desulfitobacterium hafniense DP7]
MISELENGIIEWKYYEEGSEAYAATLQSRQDRASFVHNALAS